MAESITQPDTEDRVEPLQATTAVAAGIDTIVASPPSQPTRESVIWTPRFILLFALTLVIGLSAEGLLTQAMQNNLFHIQGWILLGHTLLILAGWIALFRTAHSLWLRIGSIFGGIWSLFASLGFIVSMLPLPPDASLPTHLNAASISALLGTYICLSVAYPYFSRWDTWFFRLATPLAAVAIGVTYALLPVVWHTAHSLEVTTTIVLLFLCLFTWWLRPSCWRAHPGPTFLFGITPLILLIMSLPSVASDDNTLILSQVALLSLLLGVMRMVQGERQQAKAAI
jgi:hypothetical protein